MAKTSGEFRFRRHDNIGANDAEDDTQFLDVCFEDIGDVGVLHDCNNPKRIILGRTGSGKTALLHEFKRRYDSVISVNPEHLSFNYIANSNILQYLNSLGINLDPFYKLLWRHVFAVTILQNKFDTVGVQEQKSFADRLKTVFETKEVKANNKRQKERRDKAIDYLKKWGDSFFEDVEHRTKEVAQKFESEVTNEVKASTGFDLGTLTPFGKVGSSTQVEAGASGSHRIEIDKRTEIINRAQNVINKIQVQELTGIIELIDEVLDDPQKPYYVIIDRLDEQWADESIKHKLLKGLIDTIKEYGKVRNAKIIACFRIDLLEQLFRETRTEIGFQEDKYRSLYIPLRWNRENLKSLLDKRVSELIRDKYTKYSPSLFDVMPTHLEFGKKRKETTLDFILDRTWYRPRDVIEFFNACIRKSEGKTRLTKSTILEAEGEYSRSRLRAIAQEWYADYPNLIETVMMFLEKRGGSLKLGDIQDELVEEWSISIVCGDEKPDGLLNQLALSFSNGNIIIADVRRELASVLFRTGCVGLKSSTFAKPNWADSESYSVSPAEIDDETILHIHKGLWRVLGINSK